MFEVSLDEERKVVTAKVKGMLSVAEGTRLRDALLASAKESRLKFGFFKLIVDTVEAPVQPQNVLAVLPGPKELIVSGDDRWAVIAASSLAKVQASRILNHEQSKVFLSDKAAITWITAYN